MSRTRPTLYSLTIHSKPYTPFPVFGQLHAFAFRSRQKQLEWKLTTTQHFDGRLWRLELPMVARGWFVNDAA